MRVSTIGTTGQLAMALRAASWNAPLEPLDPRKLDVSDREALFRELDRQRPDLIINASAYTAVDRAETERERAFAVNESGPRWLAEWCQSNQAGLIHVSTDYVFDGKKSAPYLETDATNPLGVYGASKLAGEEWIRRLLERHVIVRTSWVFSEHGQNFVKTMLRLARERDELRVVADQRGRPTAANDLAVALLRLGERFAKRSVDFGTFHFAGAGATTWHGFASAIVEEQARFTGRTPKVTPITTPEFPTPAARPANSVLDTSRFESSLGVTPPAWQAGLREIVSKLAAPERHQAGF
jgi:dTDP-4-dehydrorhamnose reductase